MADEKKASGIKVLDLRKLLYITDFFVIASGRNRRQLQAVADEVTRSLQEKKLTPFSSEGYSGGSWILLDYGDVVIHLFLEETRKFYGLDMLWGDVPVIDWHKRPKKPSNKKR